MTNDFTVLVAVDNTHLSELCLSLPTWRKMKQEFSSTKYLIMYDADQLKDTDERFSVLKGLNYELVPWYNKNGVYENQREKMLTCLVAAPEYIKTPWYLKIDTDTVVNNNSKWIWNDWFNGDYVFISNPWGYTKPPNAIEIMDDWGDKIDDIKKYPRLELHPNPGSSIVSHKRIISWVFFCHTEWTRKMATYAKRTDGLVKLPIPSQDTYLVYLAQRMGMPYKTVRFKKFGFDHVSRFSKIKEVYNFVVKNA